MRILLAVISVWLIGVSSFAAEVHDFGYVQINSKDAFSVTDTATESASERASRISKVVADILKDSTLDAGKIDVRVLADGNPAVTLDSLVIAEAFPSDAQALGQSNSALAKTWATTLRERLVELKPHQSGTEKSEGGKQNSPSKPLDEEKVLLFLVQASILLLAAWVCGEGMARIGQPAVIGQLLAGVLLGQSVLGTIFPQFYAMIFPPEATQGYLLDIVCWIGTIFLLMLTGTETDLELIKKNGKAAVLTALGGTILPLIAGIALGWLMPANMLVLPNQRAVLGMFMGTVFSVSSVAIIAKVLMEMQLLRRDVGQTILASALAQDLIGCVLLALVAAFAGGGGAESRMDLIKVPVGMILFLGIGATLAKRPIFALLRWAHDRSKTDYAPITVVSILMLVSAAITQLLGLHVILGALAIGVLLAQSPLVGDRELHPFESITMGLFAPLFFAAAGLHINLTLLTDPAMLLLTVVMLLLAVVSKVGGCYLGGKFMSMNKWEALSIGFGTNARGSMGIIVGILGFSLGFLTVNLFSIIVIVSLATTAMAPALLRYGLGHVVPTDEETARLEREEKQARSFISKINRVLLPLREGARRTVSSRLLAALGQHHGIEATQFTVVDTDSQLEALYSQTLMAGSKEGNVTLISKAVKGTQFAQEVLTESTHSYDLVVIEDKLEPDLKLVFSKMIDEVAKNAHCPLLVIREPSNPEGFDIKRILVPTTGSGQSAKAAELGIIVAKATGAQVMALNVVHQQLSLTASYKEQSNTRTVVAQDLADQISALAGAFNVDVTTKITYASKVAPEIMRVAREYNADLIVLGAFRRPTSKLYLGNTINYVLRQASCAVAILSP